MQTIGTLQNKISTITTMVNEQATQDTIANGAIDPKSVLVETSANTIEGPTSQQPSESQHIYAQQVSNSSPMAVLPLNSSAKLDQEPNPFEQSFSSASKTSPGAEKRKILQGPTTTTVSSATTSTGSGSSTNSIHSMTVTSNSTTNESLKLPPVAAMTSPAGTSVMSSVPKDIASQYAWDSLRAGPLSPSMLQRPTNPDDSVYSSINPSSSLLTYQDYPPNSYQVKSESYYPHERTQTTITKHQSSQPPLNSSKRPTTIKKSTYSDPTNVTNGIKAISPASPGSSSQRRKLQMDDHDDKDGGRNAGDDIGDEDRKLIKKVRTGEDDEKRKNFLERNRLAALKCRQRKKQWLNNLQAKVEYLTNDNEQLQIQTNSLRDEIMNLKTLLLAHKDCPISQVNNNGLPTSVNPKAIGVPPSQHQPSLLNSTGGNNGTSAGSTMSAAITSSATMAPMYASRPFSNQTSSANHPHHPHHRLSTSSTGSQPPSGSLNMVMVSQHQVTAPQSSTVSSSSGVLQF